MKVAIYCRVSTVDMGQNVERQVLELREICQRNDWEIVGEYIDDGVSGTKKSRPQLDLMMKHARMRKFNKIVCLELSRIARSTKLNFVPVTGHWGTLPQSVKGAPNGTTSTQLYRRL